MTYNSYMQIKRRPGRRVKNPLERVCKTCSVLKPIDQFQAQNRTRSQDWVSYRHSCIECERKKALHRYYARQQKDKCSHCGGNRDNPKFKKCEACRLACKDSQKAHYDRLVQQVLAVYGNRCSHCMDPRTECLELDHVGGWGAKHLTRTGRRYVGRELMRWARDNNFPKTLRLLCGSCHAALSYRGELPRTFWWGDRLTSETRNSDATTDLLPVASSVMPITAPGQ